MQREISLLQNAHRKNNLIVFGVTDDESTNLDLRTSFNNLLEKLKINIDDNAMKNIKHLGKKGHRPIFIELSTTKWKGILCKNAEKLTANKTFISNDLSPEDQKIKTKLLEKLSLLISLGLKLILKDTGVIIDSKSFSLGKIERHFGSIGADTSLESLSY